MTLCIDLKILEHMYAQQFTKFAMDGFALLCEEAYCFTFPVATCDVIYF